MSPRAAIAIALALWGAATVRADLALVRDRLAALRKDPVVDLEDAARLKELAFFWTELARYDTQLPDAYRILQPRVTLIAQRDRLGILLRRQNQIRSEMGAALSLLLQAALLAHEDLLTTGTYRRPHPKRVREVVDATLPSFVGPTTMRNRFSRAVALAALSEIQLPGDPGREALSKFQVIRKASQETFRLGMRGVIAPYTPALAAAIDRDLAALRAAWSPPPPAPPPPATPTPAPTAAPPPSPPPPPPPRPRPRRFLRWLALLGALAAAAGLGFLAARRKGPGPSPTPPEPPPAPPAPPVVAADKADTDPPGRPTEPPDTPPELPDPLPLLQALEDLRGRVVHSLTGRFAIAKVLEDEPERFAEAFLNDATLRESAELLDGLVQAVEDLPGGPGDLTRHVEKMRGALGRYGKLAAFLRRARDEVAAGRRPRDMAEFQRRLAKIASHFKEVNSSLRKARAAYQVDLEALLEDRAAAFRGRLDIDIGGPGETDLLRPAATAARADLGLVLDTLLENAFQAKARTVRATFTDAGLETVHLTLVDDGEGLGDLAPEVLMKSGISTKEVGTGTGLSQARRLALTHGGTVDLAPDEGGGAQVRLEFTVGPPSH